MLEPITPDVSIVIPVYNEEEILEVATKRLMAELADQSFSYEVIIVENGSSDRTKLVGAELVSAYPYLTFISLDEADYGAAMKHGFKIAAGDIIFNFDIDYTSVDLIRQTLSEFQDYDVVICSKRILGTLDSRPWYRKFITGGFNLLLKFLLRVDVLDTHGIKGFKRPVIESVMPATIMGKDLFDTELVIRAERAGYRIKEVPARIAEIRKARSSIVQRIPRTFIGLLTLRSVLKGEDGRH